MKNVGPLTEAQTEEVAVLLTHNRTLQNIMFYAFQDAGVVKMAPLARALGRMHAGALTEMVFNDCNLGSEQIRLLCDGLMTNRTVLCLDLDQNALDMSAITHIADMLPRNGRIRTLCLRRVGLTSETVRPLTGALENSLCVLEHLDLSENSFGPDAGRSFGQVRKPTESKKKKKEK